MLPRCSARVGNAQRPRGLRGAFQAGERVGRRPAGHREPSARDIRVARAYVRRRDEPARGSSSSERRLVYSPSGGKDDAGGRSCGRYLAHEGSQTR